MAMRNNGGKFLCHLLRIVVLAVALAAAKEHFWLIAVALVWGITSFLEGTM